MSVIDLLKRLNPDVVDQETMMLALKLANEELDKRAKALCAKIDKKEIKVKSYRVSWNTSVTEYDPDEFYKFPFNCYLRSMRIYTFDDDPKGLQFVSYIDATSEYEAIKTIEKYAPKNATVNFAEPAEDGSDFHEMIGELNISETNNKFRLNYNDGKAITKHDITLPTGSYDITTLASTVDHLLTKISSTLADVVCIKPNNITGHVSFNITKPGYQIEWIPGSFYEMCGCDLNQIIPASFTRGNYFEDSPNIANFKNDR